MTAKVVHTDGGRSAPLEEGREDCAAERSFLAYAMEAVALIVVVALPITLSPFADAFFEVPKAFFLRVMGLAQALLLTGWGGRHLLQWRRAGGCVGKPQETGLLVAAGAFAAVSVITALTALNRGYAFVGCPNRGGGALTVLAGAVLFVAAAVTIRRREQVERLLTALVVGCIPCLVFAACEKAGAHPMMLDTGVFQGRVSGSFGNPNFLGSYFALVTPLALGLAWSAWRARRVASAALYGAVALALVAGIWVSASRGPLLALLAGCGVAAVALVASAGYGRLARRLAQAGIVLVAVALIVFSVRFVAPFRAGWAGEGAQAGTLRTGSVAVRLHIYRAVAERMLSSEPVRSAFGTSDPLHGLRFWLGYGPQNLMVASERYFSTALENLERKEVGIDTAHCMLLEMWAESGVLGVTAWCAVFLLALAAAVRALGFAWDQRALWQVCGMVAGGAVVASVLLAVFWGAWAWGFGFAIGTILGVLYAVQWMCGRGCVPMRFDWLALAVATSLLVFLFDTQTGVLTVSVATAAWLLLGAVQALPHMGKTGTEGPTDGLAAGAERDSGLTPGLAATLALVAAVAANAGVQLNHGLSPSVWQVWGDVVFSAMGLPGLLTVAAGLVLVAEAARWRWGALVPAAVLVGGWLADVTVRSLLLARAFGKRLATTDEALAFGSALGRFEAMRYVWLAIFCGLVALALVAGWRVRRRMWLAIGVAAVVAAATVLMFIWPRSGVMAQGRLAAAGFFRGGERPDLEAALIQRALGRSVWDDFCYIQLHLVYGRAARKVIGVSPQSASGLLDRAEQMLKKARLVAPYDPHHVVASGNFYQVLASEMTPASAARRSYALQSVETFRQASELAPGRQSIRLAVVYSLLDLLDDKPAAERELVQMLDDDPQNARACELLAYLCLRRGTLEEGDAEMKGAWIKRAGGYAKRALESPWRLRHGVDVKRLEAIVRGSGV